MKRTTLLGLFIVISTICNAQTDYYQIPNTKYHQHKGFYLSMSAGPDFAGINDKVAGQYNYAFNGTATQMDFKIGGAIKENLILHATLIENMMSGPKITSEGSSQNTSNNLALGEVMIGVGITYYVTPSNVFLSSSLGIGNFTLIDNDKSTTVSSDKGLSIQLKVGKEWWVSRKWGLGVALTYGKTNLTNRPGDNVNELMDSNNFGILFNVTLN